MNIYKVTNDKEHSRALDRIEALMDIPDDDPRMYELLYLSDIVADYEERRYPTPKLSPLEVLEELMKENGLKQKDLIPIFGSRSMVSMILSGKRNMTVDKVQKLSEFFKVPSYLFIEGGSQANISTNPDLPSPEQQAILSSPTFVQLLKSAVREEVSKILKSESKPQADKPA